MSAPAEHPLVRSSRAVIPYAVVIFLCAGACVVPPGWGWALLFLLLSTLVLLTLRIDSAELLVLTLPIAFYVSIFASRVNIAASDVFLIPVIIKVALDARKTPTRPRVRRMVATLLGLMLALLLTVMLGVVPRALSGETVAWAYLFSDAFKLVVGFVYLFVSFMVFSTKIGMRDLRFLGVWEFTASVVALLGVLGVALYSRGVDLGLTLAYRATSTFEDPNAFALYLIASMGLVMARRYLRSGRLFSLSLIPLGAGIYFSYSRGAIVAAVVAAAVFLVLSVHQRYMFGGRWLIIFIASAAAILALSPAGALLFQSRRDGTFESDVRFQLWGAAIKVWQEAPVFGAGLGQFRLASANYLDTRYSFLAHNTYLSFLAEGGLVGLGVFLAILGVIVFALLRNANAVSRLLLVSCAGIFTMAASLNLQNSRSMWVFMGIAGAWALTRHEEQSATPPRAVAALHSAGGP
jgi:O-antigen ligase